MSKRGRSWKQKIKNKLGAEKLAGIKQAMAIKKKATKEQIGKIKKGYSSYMDIQDTKNDFQKQLKRESDPAICAVLENKIKMIGDIIAHLKKNKVNEAKKLGLEYDKLYPDDFKGG